MASGSVRHHACIYTYIHVNVCLGGGGELTNVFTGPGPAPLSPARPAAVKQICGAASFTKSEIDGGGDCDGVVSAP